MGMPASDTSTAVRLKNIERMLVRIDLRLTLLSTLVLGTDVGNEDDSTSETTANSADDTEGDDSDDIMARIFSSEGDGGAEGG